MRYKVQEVVSDINPCPVACTTHNACTKSVTALSSHAEAANTQLPVVRHPNRDCARLKGDSGRLTGRLSVGCRTGPYGHADSAAVSSACSRSFSRICGQGMCSGAVKGEHKQRLPHCHAPLSLEAPAPVFTLVQAAGHAAAAAYASVSQACAPSADGGQGATGAPARWRRRAMSGVVRASRL